MECQIARNASHRHSHTHAYHLFRPTTTTIPQPPPHSHPLSSGNEIFQISPFSNINQSLGKNVVAKWNQYMYLSKIMNQDKCFSVFCCMCTQFCLYEYIYYKVNASKMICNIWQIFYFLFVQMNKSVCMKTYLW